MSELTITLTGEIRESNFDEWKDGLVERIRAVDVELSADDDFRSANDSIRQFREAEQTLKAAKQAALEQAADINRLFDAVDAVAEETRQARLTLERKVRTRRHELKQQSLQAHIDGNAATLDALPAAHRALFQDRAALLRLPADELEATIEERVGVLRALEERGGDEDDVDPFVAEGASTRAEAAIDEGASARSDIVPGGAPDETAGAATGSGTEAGADDGATRPWRVTIDLSTHRAKAEQLFTRVRDRWKADGAVTSVELSKGE